MKVKFSRESVYVPDFNGNKELPSSEQITAKLSVMDMADYVDLAEALQVATNGATEISSDKLNMGQIKMLLTNAGAYLPKYVTEVTNLEDENGKVEVASMLKFPIYFSLAAELLLALVSVSTLSEADVKN